MALLNISKKKRNYHSAKNISLLRPIQINQTQKYLKTTVK